PDINIHEGPHFSTPLRWRATSRSWSRLAISLRLSYCLSYMFRSPQPIPDEYRSVFSHLYLDIAWYGILAGSTASFLIIYATRIGATAEQVGLINAAPAIVALIFTLPATAWIQRRTLGMAVFWSCAAHRIFYLGLVFLPWLLQPNAQVWAIIGISLIMYVPYTPLQVSFQSLFADVVPSEWRGHVSGIRNAISSVTSTVTTLVCGYVLIKLPITVGYPIVCGIGFLGAAMSTLHTWFVQKHHRPTPSFSTAVQDQNGGRLLATSFRSLRLDIIRGPFGKVADQ
ncbi:MAG TPA: hypothetical protein VHO48_02560, partial [Anaerolineaceae bacterium]|nr:hypothetical protein [Anaerolineaceae bacterium]